MCLFFKKLNLKSGTIVFQHNCPLCFRGKIIKEATLNIVVTQDENRILYDIDPIKKVEEKLALDNNRSTKRQGVKSPKSVLAEDLSKNYYKVHRILTPDGSVFEIQNTKGTVERAGGAEKNSSGLSPTDSTSINNISDNFENVNIQKIKRSLKDDEEVDIKYSKKYNKGDNAFSKALTAEEWIKYNSAITTGVDVGLRINDHSMLVECEKGDYSYKLVIYDNTFEEKPIKAVYGIGNDSYSNTTIHKVAKVISDLEDAGYGRELIDKTLGNIRKNHQIILGRYSQQTGRYSKFRPVNFTSRANTQKQSNGGTVSSGTQKIGKQSLKDNTDVETSSIIDTSSTRYILSEALKGTAINDAERAQIEKYQKNVADLDKLEQKLRELKSQIIRNWCLS